MEFKNSKDFNDCFNSSEHYHKKKQQTIKREFEEKENCVKKIYSIYEKFEKEILAEVKSSKKINPKIEKRIDKNALDDKINKIEFKIRF